MNLKSIFNLKKIFTSICKLKYYISWNLFSIIGWIDFLFFSLLYLYRKSDTSGLSFVFYGGIYITITRIFCFIFLSCINSVKMKQYKFIDNQIYNIIFLLGLLIFTILSLIILILVLDIIYTILFLKS